MEKKMPAIIEFPEVIKKAIDKFGHLFTNEPERIHFAEYLTGLLIAEHKTVSGINSEFAQTTDQSCLNRWLTEVSWDEKALNKERLEWHQRKISTRYSEKGVIAVDNVLIDHTGKKIEDVGWYWDHAEKRNKLAHDYLISNYVCSSDKHYCINFRRFRKESDCIAKLDELKERYSDISQASDKEKSLTKFKDHTLLFLELAKEVIEQKIPGVFAFDSYFSNRIILNYLNKNGRYYVGVLKCNRNIIFKDKQMKIEEFVAGIDKNMLRKVEIDGKKQWYFTASMRLPKIDHGIRILILWDRKNAKHPCKILITNRRRWEVYKILSIYRKRWTGTETFHRDGKQHLGMGDCQLRNGKGHTRHMYLVMLAYSLLIDQLPQHQKYECTNIAITIGAACHKILRKTVKSTILWAIDKAKNENWKYEQICNALGLP